MQVIKLNAQNYFFKLVIDRENWCTVFLWQNNKIIDIGSDNIKVIIQKFLIILDPENFPNSNQELESNEYYNFINLSEPNTSGYATLTKKGIKIILQNSIHLDIFCTLFLSDKECNLWKSILITRLQIISQIEKYNKDRAEITKIKEENRHKEILARETNKKYLQTGIENTKRITISSVVAIVISDFIYAGFTKDSALTDKIITALLGVGTGAGGASLLIKKENKNTPEE